MKKLTKLVLAFLASAVAVQPLQAQQDGDTRQFHHAISRYGSVPFKDAKALYVWGKKWKSEEPLTPQEKIASDRAWRHVKRVGIGVGTILAILASFLVIKKFIHKQDNAGQIPLVDDSGEAPLTTTAIENLDKLIEDLDKLDSSGKAPLITTVIENLDKKDSFGKTPLINAAIEDDEKAVTRLIEAGADLDIQNEYGTTALMEAARGNNEKALKELIKAGADLNIQNKLGDTALIYAAMNNKEKALKELIEAKADLDKQNKTGDTALMWAVFQNDIKAVTRLIKAGADLDIRDEHFNRTALISAIGIKNEKTVTALINAGADLDKPDRYGHTALDHAKLEGAPFREIIKKALKAKANQ